MVLTTCHQVLKCLADQHRRSRSPGRTTCPHSGQISSTLGSSEPWRPHRRFRGYSAHAIPFRDYGSIFVSFRTSCSGFMSLGGVRLGFAVAIVILLLPASPPGSCSGKVIGRVAAILPHASTVMADGLGSRDCSGYVCSDCLIVGTAPYCINVFSTSGVCAASK